MPSYQTIFLVISLLVAAPLLVYYYRRHPHPRFRPKVGEMAAVTLIAGMACWGGSALLGTILDDPDQFKKEFTLPTPASPSGGGDVSLPGSSDSSSEREAPRRKSEPSPEDFKK